MSATRRMHGSSLSGITWRRSRRNKMNVSRIVHPQMRRSISTLCRGFPSSLAIPGVFCWLALVLLPVMSCNKDPFDYEHDRTSYFTNLHEQPFNDSVIVCVTFNIHLGFRFMEDPWDKDDTGADMRQIQHIADILKQINPDVIALQEVPRNRYNAVVKDFVEQLAGTMNMNYAFGSHGYNDPYGIYPVYGEWGTAVLTKYKIGNIQNVEVEYLDKWQKRSLLDATLEMNGSTAFHVMSAHYLPSDQGAPNTASFI